MNVEELIEKHLVNVQKAAKRYYSMIPDNKRGMITVDELISAGNEALVKAAKKFDQSRKNRFITYAYQWIDHAIKKELIYYLGAETLTYDGDIESFADQAGLSAAGPGRPASADVPESEETANMIGKMEQLGLSETERKVCCMFYGIGQEEEKNLKRIGRKLHLTEMQVRRMKQSADKKMKQLQIG
ncbi:MAG: sigma-70 family RNA polymerase sigma factor [Lachnospiraceae bacterium]|nr:sigma-70 family RNA polymerase sigma factor [Lachnospiraceae bacterium]